MPSRLAALIAWAGLAACTRAAPEGEQGKRLKLEPCRVKGFGGEAQCGSLRVFEDRAARKGRELMLRVVVLPALAAEALPDPLFLLAGGPGQAAPEVVPPLARALQPLRRARDLVFVDQRGTGSSNKLDCKLLPKNAPLSERFESRLEPEKLAGCARGLQADPRLYSTPPAMDDLDDVRAALGYQRVNLWGGSYGTRAALVYARQHPAHLRAMILDGVAPVSLRLPLFFARDAQRSLDLMLEQCESDPACKARFPQLRTGFDKLLARLEAAPAKVRVDDPLTGDPVELEVTRRRFTDHLRGLLYVPELTALLPLTIDRAASGDFRPFVAQADQATAVSDSVALGMFLSVICAEDVPFISADELDKAGVGSFLGGHAARELALACKAWPRGEVPAGYREPVRSEAPALLLSGELDPVTPPSWAEEALRTLPNGVHVIAPGVGHGVTSVGCMPELVQRFLDQGSAKGLDAACMKSLRRPPFFLGFAGPQP